MEEGPIVLSAFQRVGGSVESISIQIGDACDTVVPVTMISACFGHSFNILHMLGQHDKSVTCFTCFTCFINQ